jgi:hypothetical protein
MSTRVEGRRGSFGHDGEQERGRRESNARGSERPCARRRRPVERQAGSAVVTR